MTSTLYAEIRIMQDNLCELRKIAGWTAETLARKLGVTKQTISNLETRKVKISRVQYIAVRSVFECELSMNPENTTLRKVMSILFDVLPPRYEEHREAVRTAMVSIASIAAAGIGGLQLHAGAMALLAPLGPIATQASSLYGGEPSLSWLQAHLESQDMREQETATEENAHENS